MEGRRKRKVPLRDGAPAAVASRKCLEEEAKPPRKKEKTSKPVAAEPLSAAHCYLSGFPDEILIHIFSYLDSRDKGVVARVCWRWWGLVNLPSLWTDVKASLNLDKLTQVDFGSLKRRGIRHVTVLSCSNFEKMKELIASMSKLETLNTNRIRLTNNQMKTAFSEDLPCLKEFSLHSRNLDSDSLECILSHMSNLQRLKLDVVVDNKLFSVMSSLRNVRTIHLYHCSLWVGNMDAPVQHAEMPCVSELSLKNMAVGDVGLRYLCRAFPNLEKLQVQLRADVTADGIQKLADMKHLQELRIVGLECKTPWMPLVSKILTKLKVLVLHLFRSVTDNDLVYVAQMNGLQELTVSADLIGEQGWKQLSQGCLQLRKLCLIDCARMSKAGAQYIGQLPLLDELQLSLCAFRNPGFKYLCQALPRVRKLYLRNNHCITDTAFKYVAKMPSLEELHVMGSDSVGDLGLGHLCEGQASLQDVNLFYMDHVTDRGLMDLARGLKSLKRILVCDCERLTDGGVSEMAREFPHLHVVRRGMAKKKKGT